MNYNSVILVGVLVLTAIWWIVHAHRKYPGPKLSGLYLDETAVDRPYEKGEREE